MTALGLIQTLIGNVERALSFLWKNLRARHELIPKNTRRINVLKIPSDALREALINAVTHRNYRTRGVSMMTGLKFLILEGFTES